MKFCKNCGKEIQPDTKFCPYCGTQIEEIKIKPPPPKKINTAAIVFIILVVLAILIAITQKNKSKDYSKSSSKLSNSQEQVEIINKLISENVLRIEAHYNKAYISRAFWNNIEVNVKENFSRSLAIYCGNKKGTQLYWVEIYDKMSGKKLAKYSRSWGFDIY